MSRCMKLEVSNLSWNNIIKDVSFNANSGEFIWLMGLNGSGKSSLLRCLAGINHISVDAVLFDGKSSLDAQKNGLIGYVPQHSNFSNSLTVGEAITICADRYPRRSRAINEVLEEVRLSHARERNLSVLSGGERQKFLLALALIHSPEVLLLDEPFSHLDIRAEKEILGILKNQKDKLIIMVSHDHGTASMEASKILMMHDGTLSILTPPFSKDRIETSILFQQNQAKSYA